MESLFSKLNDGLNKESISIVTVIMRLLSLMCMHAVKIYIFGLGM